MADETALWTYHELSQKTVAELRDLARGRDEEALHGYSTMHEDQLRRATV